MSEERCECCAVEWEECWACAGDGYLGHDCGEDTCCCLDPEDNIVCDVCHGEGGYETTPEPRHNGPSIP